MKKDAYYFPHDSNATNDPKIMIMMATWGLEAYGIYWTLIEHLREQPDYRSNLKILRALAARYGSTEEKYRFVVFDFDLFQLENDEFFYSETLLKRMLPLEEKREKMRELAKKRWDKQPQLQLDMHTHSVGNASKVKESKVKESIKEQYFKDEEVNTAFIEYLELRKKNKSPNTERVINRLKEKLRSYGPTKEKALEVINKAITCNWKDFYSLKD